VSTMPIDMISLRYYAGLGLPEAICSERAARAYQWGKWKWPTCRVKHPVEILPETDPGCVNQIRIVYNDDSLGAEWTRWEVVQQDAKELMVR
jgi:hypothetical protein